MKSLSLLLLPYQVYVSRMSGGLPPKLPWKTDQILFGLPYGLVALLLQVHWGWIVFCIAWAALIKNTGHGQWMTLPYSMKFVGPERLDFLLLPFFGQDPRSNEHFDHLRGKQWHELTDQEEELLGELITDYGTRKLKHRNIAGLAVNGLVLGAPVILLLLTTGNIVAGVSMCLLHCAFGLGYVLGWSVCEDKPLPILNPRGEATAWGEIFRGLFSAASCCIAVWLLW